MRINQAVILIVTGSKGNTSKKWWRLSRTTLSMTVERMRNIPHFYYAKIYDYQQGNKVGTRKSKSGKSKPLRVKGTVKNQIAYIYFKNGSLTSSST